MPGAVVQAVGAGRERGAAILNLGSGEGLSLPCFTLPLVPGLCPAVKQQVSASIWCHSDVQAGSRVEKGSGRGLEKSRGEMCMQGLACVFPSHRTYPNGDRASHQTPWQLLLGSLEASS